MNVSRSDSRRAFRVMSSVCLATAVLTGACEQPEPPPPATQPTETRYDPQYVAALSVADEFCHAWSGGDLGTGRAILSRRFIRKHSDKRLRDMIVGSGNPRHAGYEIGNGRRLPGMRYAFDVRLFLSYSGQHSDRLEFPLVQIVLAQDDGGNWWVDEFPVPESPTSLRPGPVSRPVR
jgi:hypothetical protein